MNEQQQCINLGCSPANWHDDCPMHGKNVSELVSEMRIMLFGKPQTDVGKNK